MTSLHKIYEDIFNKSRFLAQDNYFTPINAHGNNCWQKLGRLDDTINQLPESIHQYIAYLCSLYKRNSQKEQSAPADDKQFSELNPTLKKVCEVYAIGLLVCDDLLTRINYLNINNKVTRVTIPTISYNNVCNYLSWISNTLHKAIVNAKASDGYANFQLSDAEITPLNCYSKLLTNVYNSSALGIFRKQPIRRFSTENIVIRA